MSDIPNSFNKGKGWDGNGYKPFMVIYNGETKTLQKWAMQLGLAPETLRGRLLKVERKQMSWDEAMADPDTRAELYEMRRKKNTPPPPKPKTKKQAKIDDAFRSFLNAPIPR